MSQIYLDASGSSPSIPTSFVTDSGTAVPAANILNVLADDTNSNNDNGIQTTGSGNTVTVQLTNRATSTVTTTDATPTTLLTLSLGAGDGTYIAEGNLIAYNTTDTASSAYTFVGAARSTAGVGTEIAIENKDIWEEASMEDATFTVSISGNDLLVTVTGIAGKTLNWSGFLTYRYVG